MTPLHRDKRVRRLRADHGWTGYGVYIALLEMLREEHDNAIDHDDKAIEILATELGVPIEMIRSIVDDYNLFDVEVIDGREQFVSMLRDDNELYQDGDTSAKEADAKPTTSRYNMSDEAREQRRKAGKKSASKRWHSNGIVTKSVTKSNEIGNENITKSVTSGNEIDNGNLTKSNEITSSGNETPQNGNGIVTKSSPVVTKSALEEKEGGRGVIEEDYLESGRECIESIYNPPIIPLTSPPYSPPSPIPLNPPSTSPLPPASEETSHEVKLEGKAVKKKRPSKAGESRTAVATKEPTLTTKLREVFDNSYTSRTGQNFYWDAKHMSAIKKIGDKLGKAARDKSLPTDHENMARYFAHLLASIQDPWILNNYNPLIIESKYNDIITQHHARQSTNRASGRPYSSDNVARASAFSELAREAVRRAKHGDHSMVSQLANLQP